MAELKWEYLPSNPGETINRAKVPGGWLVREKYHEREVGTMAFVPDPKHEWN